MLTNFLKSGLTSLESISFSSIGGQTQKGQGQPSVQLQKIVEETLAALNVILTDKLGERIEGEGLKELTTELLKSKNLESNLIQTKQRYNQLVNKSTALYQQARKISASVGEFITSINMFLESDELLVPLNEIQKGINDLVPEKVEKQMNYLVKIFANNFQEIIDKNVRMTEKTMNDEIKLMKNLNKNLESEIVNIKNHKNTDESKYLEQAMRITTLNEKIGKLINQKSQVQKQLKQSQNNIQQKNKSISDQEQEIKKLKQRQHQLLEKIKQSQLKSLKAEKQFKESNTETESLNIIIEKLKQREEEFVEEMEAQYKKKESLNQLLRKKLCNQKAVLEEKVERIMERVVSLESELQNKDREMMVMKNQLDKYKDSTFIEIDFQEEKEEDQEENDEKEKDKEKEDKDKGQGEGKELKGKEKDEKKSKLTVKQIMERLSSLEYKNKEIQSCLQREREINVNKQVLKGLFLNYDDESKEWSVRRNIKYQIYSLLDLKDKMPKPQQPKNSKWFGLF